MFKRRRTHFRRYKRSSWSRLQATSSYKQRMKDRGLLRCDICGWFDPAIQPFFLVECHHIKRVADGGKNVDDNYVLTCPNHHALADRISRLNKNLSMTKAAIIALIREHEFNRLSVMR